MPRKPVRRNPLLVTVTNPPIYSERGAVGAIKDLSASLGPALARADLTDAKAYQRQITEWAARLLAQLDRGIHANPPRGRKFSNHVQAIVYEHITEGPRAHGFGNADPDLRSRGNALTMTGLHERTGAAMYALPDGSILIRNTNGKPLWREDR